MSEEHTGDEPRALLAQLQLNGVLNEIRCCQSLSEAGRKLFARFRARRSSTNDADRIRKYLAKFGLTWESIHQYNKPFDRTNRVTPAASDVTSYSELRVRIKERRRSLVHHDRTLGPLQSAGSGK